jgi:hypothetical protein
MARCVGAPNLNFYYFAGLLVRESAKQPLVFLDPSCGIQAGEIATAIARYSPLLERRIASQPGQRLT